MSNVSVLDCTLRDGGYCNSWEFGYQNIKSVISKLTEANIEIIECGFLTQKVKYDLNTSRFNTIDQIKSVLPENRNGSYYVGMINFGEYDINDLPECDHSSIDGIRITFHKKDLVSALEYCRKIKEKGYMVFVQAMVSISYSDNEFIELIDRTNEIEPYAFYIVDSFGSMQTKDLMRLFYIIDHNLKRKIKVGFHSHNNMQLAFSNAQSLLSVKGYREIILDSSVYGMGRGAGNLNTELLVEYLNVNNDGNYDIKPLLNIIDEILNTFYKKNYWGFSLPNYISAKYNSHPNYASYLTDKNTLTVKDINSIFEMMEFEKRLEFDKEYIETLYVKYMKRENIQNSHLSELQSVIYDKKVLLIAPGRSSVEEKEKVLDFIKENNPIVVSVNFEYPYYETDYTFISNIRRFSAFENKPLDKCIITSNIVVNDAFFQTDYSALLNDVDGVNDNAGLMCLKFFINMNVKELYLAGFDGYSHDTQFNYAQKNLEMVTKNSVLDAMNFGMNCVLKKLREQAKIEFITTPNKIV